jgi:hypothetical protein
LILLAYTVVPADLRKDRQVIIDLWRRNLADVNHLEEKYDWHFLKNPFGPGQIWILHADGQPIGTTSLGMRPLKLGETVAIAGVACDLAVNKDHRFLQPALMLQRALLASAHPGIRILYGFPNPGGASVMKYVGYRELCRVHRYAKILRISPYLERLGKLGTKDTLIARMADRGFAAFQSFRRWRRNGWITKPLPCFDQRFDELWSRVSSRHSALIVRDQRFLNWRYHECPLREYKTLGLLAQDESRLLGYLVYCVEDSTAVCVDLLAPGGAHDVASLLSSWAAVAWGDGVASLSVGCSDAPLAATLVRQGFSQRSAAWASKLDLTRRREPSKTLFTHERPSGMERAVADRWYCTEGDLDY